jgi:hypothetical protein
MKLLKDAQPTLAILKTCGSFVQTLTPAMRIPNVSERGDVGTPSANNLPQHVHIEGALVMRGMSCAISIPSPCPHCRPESKEASHQARANLASQSERVQLSASSEIPIPKESDLYLELTAKQTSVCKVILSDDRLAKYKAPDRLRSRHRNAVFLHTILSSP